MKFLMVALLSIVVCICSHSFGQDTIAFWGLNEGAGNMAKEKVSNSLFTLKTKWPVAEWVSGVRKTALRTDGYTTYLEGNSSNNFPSGAFSVTAWLAPDTYPVNMGAIWTNVDPVSGRGAYVALDKFGRLAVSFTIGSQVLTYNSIISALHAKWNFIAVNVDAANGQVSAFLNGAPVISEAFTNGSLTWPTNKTFIGRASIDVIQEGLFPTNYLNGIIDEVIIRNSLLTPQQITTEYNSLKPATDPDMSIPASRFAGDFYRPKYHAVPKAGWGNESHGLIYYGGKYHMFYQKNGNGPFFGFQNWGHFTSNDLVNWKEEEVAIWPQPVWESVGNWSGHLVIDDANYAHILYTGVDGVKAAIGSATSSGDLLHWNKNASNPLVPASPLSFSNNDFRDPYVFKEGSTWYMIIGSGLKSPQTGTVFLYKSPDLNSWQFISPLFIDQSYLNDPGTFWEMPVFRKFGDKYMLLVNKKPSQGSPARAFYWVGNFVNESFVPANPRSKNLEIINHLLSPTVNFDAQNNQVAIGIIPDLLPATEQYNHGWAHVFSLPRTWTMVNDTLYQQPHFNLQAIRKNATNYTNLSITTGGSNYFNKSGWQLEIKATINPGTAKQVGFILDKNSGNTEYTRIYYDYQNFNIVADHSKSSTNPNTPKDIQSEYFYLEPGQPVAWNIFIDGSVIDVFINNKWAFATRAFPVNASSNFVDLFASGGTATLTSGTIWEMNPSILPVSWLSFTAGRVGKAVDLQWKVSREKDNKLFEIERSVDGKRYLKIGAVAAGNANGNYQYTDNSPVDGKNYYRIMQVDHDGNYSFSQTRVVDFAFTGTGNFSFLKNNPANGFIEIGINKKIANVVLKLYDASGKTLSEKRYSNLTENSVITVPANDLPHGIYSAVLNDGTHFEIHKVLTR